MQGGYTLFEASSGKPEVILMGTGSELSLCVEAREQLESEGIATRVVSMPCWELFEDQSKSYREFVLPKNVSARVAVEAGIEQGWQRYLGDAGEFVGMSSFGGSAPYQELYAKFGITVDHVVAAAKRVKG